MKKKELPGALFLKLSCRTAAAALSAFSCTSKDLRGLAPDYPRASEKLLKDTEEYHVAARGSPRKPMPALIAPAG